MTIHLAYNKIEIDTTRLIGLLANIIHINKGRRINLDVSCNVGFCH